TERTELDAYGAALSHFQFARVRQPGETKVRLYNPHFDSDGWESTHTAIEIVTDDMPFLLDSVGMELNRRGYGIHLLVHPVMRVRRGGGGQLTEVLPPHSEAVEGGIAESVIHVEVDRQTDPERLEALREHLLHVIGEVRAVVEDWPSMRERALELTAENGEVRISDIEGTGLGILRQEGGARSSSRRFDKLPAGVRALALAPYLLNVTKANSRATVHRPAFLDYVGVKRFDDTGRVIGERRFLGLYTHKAYRAHPSEIPLVRRKYEAVLARADFPPESHNYKALVEILETHPRDELFQTPVGELFDIA